MSRGLILLCPPSRHEMVIGYGEWATAMESWRFRDPLTMINMALLRCLLDTELLLVEGGAQLVGGIGKKPKAIEEIS